jgi:amino acid transporter
VIFAASRQLYALGRAGHFPLYLGRVNKRGVPVAALLTGCTIAYVLAVVVRLRGSYVQDNAVIYNSESSGCYDPLALS